MDTSNDQKCRHYNTARYCDLCEVEALREERLRLYDQLDKSRRAQRSMALAMIVLSLLCMGAALIRFLP